MLRAKPAVAATAVIAALCFASMNAVAAEPANAAEKDIKTSTCKDVMRLSGEDRDISLAFVHGYVLGKKGATRYNIDVLAGVTDRFIDYCLDHPNENALQAFEKLAK